MPLLADQSDRKTCLFMLFVLFSFNFNTSHHEIPFAQQDHMQVFKLFLDCLDVFQI